MGTLYLLVLLLPSILAECTVQRATSMLTRAVHEFSVELVKKLGKDTENHFAISSLSLWILLSSVSIGADLETLSEMKQVLHHHPNPCYTDAFFEIVKEITNTSDGSTLERSSTLFIDKSMNVSESFKKKLTGTGLCDIMALPFVDFKTSATTINSYVSKAMHDTVQEIVSPYDLEGVLLILVDAMYFESQWQYQFDPSKTDSTTFHDEAGNPTGEVNMMFRKSPFNVLALNQIQAKVLELPYGNGDRYSMLIFLPHTNSSVTTVLNLLDHISLFSIFTVFKRNSIKTVHVELPRFQITSEQENLKELLIDMGLKKMFDSSGAKFSQISSQSLHISKVIQKGDIEVTEEGIVASGASGADSNSTTSSDQFIVNKPFVYMIVDKSLNIALFTGAYSKPTSF